MYGKRYCMLNIDAMGYDPESTDPLYKHIAFYICRNSETKLSYGIFYDNMSNGIFDMGQELDNYHEHYKYFHYKGLRLCANIKPALLLDHPKFKELECKELFVKEENSDNPYLCQYWDELGAQLDFTNKETIKWWKEQVTKQLLEYGIDSTWNDNNEYEIWGKSKVNGFGNEMDLELVRSIMPLLMIKSSFEAQKELNEDKRPYLISRSGCLGIQRYVQTWSGDNYTSWKTLKYNIKMGNRLSLSGIYNHGHGIGGFSGDAPEPELFIKWVQQGIMYPRFTIHSWNDDKTVNEPWMYEEYTELVSNLLKQRNKIIPYIYDLLYKAHRDYEPIIKPTLYDFGDIDEKTFEENNEFMLGKSLLVAPIVVKRERKVYLPKNKFGWYDFNIEIWYESGQEVIIDAPLEYLLFEYKEEVQFH